MAYALQVRNAQGNLIINHVAIDPYEDIRNLDHVEYVREVYPDIEDYYTNSYELVDYIRKTYPNFVIKETTFDIESLFK